MSSTSYNPFTPIGRYNIKKLFYDNKKPTIGVTFLVILVLIFAFYSVYSQKDTSTQNFNVYRPLPPQYGVGPYGYGLYAPPKELMDF